MKNVIFKKEFDFSKADIRNKSNGERLYSVNVLVTQEKNFAAVIVETTYFDFENDPQSSFNLDSVFYFEYGSKLEAVSRAIEYITPLLKSRADKATEKFLNN